ncbi:Muniscin C-terminal mu homology domain-containing protein [Choanephora cucurbitarum]|nr:Muniscin C-terminal mu homology domain-containing protein [Choanephora cucurbitarum]
MKLNDELADYFKERAQIEDTYAKSIAKLAKKNHISNKSALGTFLPLWETLQAELDQLSTIHTEYASAIVETVENPLRAALSANGSYAYVQSIYDHIQRIARLCDDVENKIHRAKKSSKNESKAAEYNNLREYRFAELQKTSNDYLEKLQPMDEYRLDLLKSLVHQFEDIQQHHAQRVIELSSLGIATAASLSVDEEINHFCRSHSSNSTQPSQPHSLQEQETASSLIEVDQIVPEPSISAASSRLSATPSSTPPNKKDRKKFFSTLVSIRRKPKADTSSSDNNVLSVDQFLRTERKRSVSNADSVAESAHSATSYNTMEHQQYHHESSFDRASHANGSIDLASPSSPTSMNTSIMNAPSINESFSNLSSSQQPPLILVDAEGYSIPPPDRSAWPNDNSTMNDSLIDTDDMNSDAESSVFGNPRIRVDIRNEVVNEEDASQSAVALNRVATLLKEKNSTSIPTRRLRGRREMRATQLYSVVEQGQIASSLNKVDDESASDITPTVTASSSSLSNPFEASQERIIEEDEEEVPTINVHTTETLHVVSRGGQAEQPTVLGEISIEYKGPIVTEQDVCFRLNSSFGTVETTEYVEVMEGHHDVFKVNTHLFENQSAPVVCIKYQVTVDEAQVPLVVKHMWKCETDKSRVLIKYHATKPHLENVAFVTLLSGDVQSASSIPDGELILAQKRMRWYLGDINHTDESVIKAQFNTLEQATPQPIAVRFEIKDQLLTDAHIEQGRDHLPSSLWANIGTNLKSVKTGKYVAEV